MPDTQPAKQARGRKPATTRTVRSRRKTTFTRQPVGGLETPTPRVGLAEAARLVCRVAEVLCVERLISGEHLTAVQRFYTAGRFEELLAWLVTQPPYTSLAIHTDTRQTQ